MQDNKYPFNILFVEDEKHIRDNYVAYLKMFFNEVYEVSNGEEAYEIYKEKTPDLMIVDIHLPKMSGIELLKKIRETDQNTRAIMLTAHTDTALLLEAASLKLTKYLVKPVSRSKLKNAIKLAVQELNSFQISSLKRTKLKDSYSWNHESKELACNDRIIALTKKEKEIFDLLVSNLNKAITYEEIIYEIWPNVDYISENSVKTLIKGLRRKLPKDMIKNIFGIGYKMQ